MDSSNNLRKRLYQNLLHKQPKQNHLLGSDGHTKSAILKPKVALEAMNMTVKMSPVFNKGKIIMENKMKSPQIPKKVTPIPVNKDKISKQGKAVIQQGKLKSKANLKPHDIFAFYDAFPEMSEDFFYLNRVTHPYDYQIVTYSQRNPMQYMTISFKGVTLYHEKQAQFLTKQEWLADEKIYYSLQKIDFFKQYKISKNFTIWKNRMRRHYMKEMSNLLNQSLFFSYQYPRYCLLKIRKTTNVLKNETYFMPTSTIQSLQPAEYQKNAEQYIEHHFVKVLKQTEDLIVEHLQEAILEQIKQFKIQNNIKINDVGDYDQKQQKQGYVYSQQAILRKQYKKVNRLIKLADNILIESKIQLLHQCLFQLIEKIEDVKHSDSKSQWIKCTAELLESQDSTKKIQWNPTLDGLKAIFKDIINLAITKMSDLHEKVGSREKFQKYRTAQQNENRKDQKRNTLKYIIQDSQFYSQLMSTINSQLQQQFRKTQKQQVELGKYIDIYTKHKSLPQIKQIFGQYTAAEYIQLVRQWREDNQQMHSLPMNKNDGLLVFDYSLLRAAIHQVPKKTLTSFLTQLPEQTKKKYNYLVNESQVHLEQINNYPINMEEFVQFNQAVKRATSALDELIDGSKSLIQMVALIQQNKTPSSDFNKINPKKAIQNINKLKAKVDESNAKYDQSLSKFKKQLQSRVSRVKATVKQLTSKFQVIPFDNISSQITPTLEKLHEIFPSIQKLEQQALAIQQIEWQLSLPTNQLDDVHGLHQRSIDVKNLWECKEKWNDLLLQIFHKHYKQIDCKQLKSKWEEFSKKNTDLLKSLPDNQVLKKLIGEITEFQNLLETIVSLTSPNLQQKSWRQISQYLAYELNIEDENKLPFLNIDDPEYTVEWLINKNISLYKEKISFIVQKSQKQKQLQANLSDFKIFISTIVFQTVTKKREVILIEKNQQLQKNIKEKISTLYSLIRNQYSDSLKNQAEVMIKHYEYMEEIMEGMHSFRKEWEKYEPFFQNNAVSSKLLTKEAKEFSSWELQWKKIIKNITNDPAYFYRKICDQTMGVNCSRAILKSMSKTSMFLDLVKKGIEEFLQKKRIQFPRYCLFTDEELLTILSKVDHRRLIVPEIITTLYDSIKLIEYDDESGAVLSVTTSQDEKFILHKQSAFKIQSEMEDLLKITEDQIKKSMGHTIRTVFGKYIEEEISRESLLTDNLVQVALQVDFIAWVRLAEETYLINEPVGDIEDWLGIQQQQIKELCTLMHTSKQQDYFKYTQFMVQSLYFRQKTLSLKANNITDTTFYEWQRIPKMIMTNNDIHLRQLDGKIAYSYEILNQKQIVVIQAQTEKVWINLINAISIKDGKNVIGLRGDNIQSIKDLAFYLGQSIRSIHFSQTCNIKTVQKLLTGCMHIGTWMHFAPISSPEILSYIAYHINSNRRSTNFQSMSSTLQVTKNAALNNSFVNAVFLFESGEKIIELNFVDHKSFRNVTLHSPNQKYVLSVLCEAQQIPKEIGNILLTICQFCRNTFEFSKSITESFLRSVLKEIKDKILWKLSTNQIKDAQILGFITFYVVSEKLLAYFSPVDYELFHTFKTSFLPNYQQIKTKFIQRFSLHQKAETHPVNRYLDFCSSKHLYTKQFVNQAIKAYDMLKNDQKLGVILSGQILSGKSQIISFIESVYRFQLKKQQQNFEVFKLYSNAYQFSDIIKSYSQQKKERKEKQQKLDRSQKQKTERINQDLGILQNFLVSEKTQKWIVIDGKVQNGMTEFLNDKFEEILVSNYGAISKEKNQKHKLQKVSIIIETLNSSEFSPSSFYNYSLCHISSLTNTVETLVKAFFQKTNVKRYLKGLSEQSSCYIEQQLIINLTKVEQKGNIKSKALQFLYPFSENEITLKCLKVVQCVFKLNQESIREKEKNMKKTIEKFVQWCILIVLYLHVLEESQAKLEKRFTEVCKCENSFQDSVIKHIIYPGSGIEVQPVNGLRTQSSLFEIPEKGIVTSITTTDFNDFNNFMNSKPNKFYEEISLETISMIRVNHDESNLFNYYSQLFAYSNLANVLTGPTGTGKKSMLQLYAKNIRQRAFIHSIRYHRKVSLMENFEKPYRKYNSLQGVLLKSPSASKDVAILIDDLNLVGEQKQTLEFFRMLLNENGFVNKNGKLRKLTEDNNNISILTNCIDPSESVVRLSSRLMFFQSTRNSIQKLSSIFSPYLKAWSKANNLTGEIQRIFTSQNGDTLLDATLKIFEFMEEMYKSKKSQKDFSMNTLLLRPRIGDISKVLSCICLTQEAKKYTLGYYSDLWANEIMRVFEDRLSPSQKDISKSLMEVVKKQYFLKFKQNFQYNPKQLFIFSSYLSDENRFYERMYDLQHLQQMIENAYESHTITVPVKLFFSQLLKEILKVYRVLEITNGHMILFHLNRKVRHYLLELGSQVAQAPLLHMKKSILTPERDILAILQFQESISIFEDLDDITEEQIYQFTCLVNKNSYQFDLKPQIRQKIKIKVTKYLRQLISQISTARENNTQLQKVKIDNVKDKQTLYISQKLEEQLEPTMQEIMMNSVHFLFGASPINPKTKKLLFNQVDLVGEMHFSFFDIPEQSLVEISKQILTFEDVDEGTEQSQQISKKKSNTKQLQKQAEIIMNDCLKIYHSLPETQRNYNALLTICENIMTDRLKLKQQTQNYVTQLQNSIQNYQKALQFITQNESKLEASLIELQLIKSQQSILSQKLQNKSNEINELQLNINQNEDSNYENSSKKLLLEQKNQQLQAIQNQLKEIKMKKDKNDIETRQARKMIQLSRDYLQLIMDVTEIQKQLNVQKQTLANIQKLLALWWSLIIYSSNRDTDEIIDRLNEWIRLIGFKENFVVENCQDILDMFELIIAPLAGVIPALASVGSQGKFKVLLLMFMIYRHDETISQNRIITLYDPCKVYPSVFKFFPVQSQLGNYALGQTIRRYDDDFWTQIEKHKRGLIFLDESIESRQKKEIESHIVKRRLFHLNRFVALVNKKQRADITFAFEKSYFINHLKLQSLLTEDTTLALEIMQTREDFMKETRKLREMKKNLRCKLADIKFEMETDTEELGRLQRDIGLLQDKCIQHQTKVSLQNLKVTQEKIITKMIDELYKNTVCNSKSFNNQESNVFSLQKIQKLYRTLREIILRFVSDLRDKTEVLHRMHRKNSLEVPQQLGERRSIRPTVNMVQLPSQVLMSLPKSQFELSKEDQQMVDQMIGRLIQYNFSQSKQLQDCDDDLFDMDFVSLQLQDKVPIIIIDNNFVNQQLIISRQNQNRPINLLYNSLSTMIIDSSTTTSSNQPQPSTTTNNNQEKMSLGSLLASNSGTNSNNSNNNNKIFLFYNDEVHFNSLMQLTNKYIDEFRSIQKKHCIYLYTNMSYSLLVKNENNVGFNYKLFYYCGDQQSSSFLSSASSSSQQNEIDEFIKSNNNNSHASQQPLTEKSTKTEMFIRLMQHLSHCKSYNRHEIEKYSEYLLSKVPSNNNDRALLPIAKAQLSRYLLDVGFGAFGQEEMLEKIIYQQINANDVNFIVSGKGQNQKMEIQSQKVIEEPGNVQEQKIEDRNIELKTQFTHEIFEEISQELPNVFNPSQFSVPTSKDPLSFEIQNLANVFNKKLRQVKSLLQKNLDRYTLTISKLYDSYSQQGLYPVPTSEYIRGLNKEYISIRKLLIQNGLLVGPSTSMNKIGSSKVFGMGSMNMNNMVGQIIKSGMFIDQKYFNMRIFNQFKVRASRKLKIPFSRVNLLFILQKKTQGFPYSNTIQKMLTNIPPELLISINASLVNAKLKSSTPSLKDEKDSSKFVVNRNKDQNEMLRLLVIPYDSNNIIESQNYFNPVMIADHVHVSMKKKTIFGEMIMKREEVLKEKEKQKLAIVQTIKLKMYFCLDQSQEKEQILPQGGQQIGTMQLPLNEVSINNYSFLLPFVQINSKKL